MNIAKRKMDNVVGTLESKCCLMVFCEADRLVLGVKPDRRTNSTVILAS